MLHAIVQVRAMLAMTLAVAVGTWGLHAYPVRLDGDIFLRMIFVRTPVVFHVLTYGYATLWFTTPFFALSLLLSLVAIVVSRGCRRPPAAHAERTRASARATAPVPGESELLSRRQRAAAHCCITGTSD